MCVILKQYKGIMMRWIFGLMFVFGSLWAEVIVIASDGNNVKAGVSIDASRCDYYLFFNEEGSVLKSIKNPHKVVMGGASAQLMKLLRKEKASHFIAGRVGMKLENALIDEKIEYTIFDGSAEKAIRKYTE